jgi:hypothetical protein
MLKMVRYGLVLLVCFLVSCNGAREIPVPVEEGFSWLVSPKLLQQAGLETVWQTQLPLRQGENLRTLHILGSRIYALSDRNYIVSLDREKGGMIFGRSFAPVGFPILGLELYEDELFSIVGSELVEIAEEFGTERGTKRLDYRLVCPAARNSSYFYLSGSDRRIHTLRADDKVQVFEVAADNASMITSVIADEAFVIFGTETGNVVSITADGPVKLWQFDAAGGIAGPIVRDGTSLFFASKDTNVYRVDMVDSTEKQFVWKHQTAAVLDRAPRVTQEVVYQYVRHKGMVAIDKASGKLIWEVPGGIDLLTEAAGKAYVMGKGELVVMDNKKAKRLYSVNFAGVSRYTANMADSKIYIADMTGRIACLKPVK